jgi:hypothetical protein
VAVARLVRSGRFFGVRRRIGRARLVVFLRTHVVLTENKKAITGEGDGLCLNALSISCGYITR